jgi:hypothetical protein
MKKSLPVRGAFGQNHWCLYQEPAPPTQGGHYDPSHPFGARQDLHFALPPGPWDRSSPEWIAIDTKREPDHPARLVDEAVAQLDLSPLINAYAGTGSAVYSPGLMLRIAGGKGVRVRREKVRIFSGSQSRPAFGSLQPVAIGAAAEVTKPPEPSIQRAVLRPREQVDRNASELPMRPRNSRRGSRPIPDMGKDDVAGEQGTGWNTPAHGRSDPAIPPGYRRQHACAGDPSQNGKPCAVRSRDPQPDAREEQAGPRRGGGRVRSPDEAG